MSGNRGRTDQSRGARPHRPRCARLFRAVLGALSGLVAALAALATAELAAAPIRSQAGPVTAVGGAVIDRTPAAVYTTLEKQSLMTSGSGESFKVNDSVNVVCGNVQTANANVEIIDTVLTPPIG
ncbi:hypothetical protein ABIA33_007227 [Streptacidiphilus sp. MAP12-16]